MLCHGVVAHFTARRGIIRIFDTPLTCPHEHPRLVGEHPNAEVHFHERVARVAPFGHVLSELLVVFTLRRISVEPDIVAVFATQQLINRHVIGFPGEVPQGHLNATDAPGRPALPAKLLDLLENLLHVARIFAQQPAFQHQRVVGTGSVAHLTPAHQTLVGVDANDGAAKRNPAQNGHPHVRNFQVRRFGVARHFLGNKLQFAGGLIVEGETQRQATQPGVAQKIPPVGRGAGGQ